MHTALHLFTFLTRRNCCNNEYQKVFVLRGVCATGLCPSNVPDEEDDKDVMIIRTRRTIVRKVEGIIMRTMMPVIKDPSQMAVADKRIVKQVHLNAL